MYSKRKC